jgi:hypothetical protein
MSQKSRSHQGVQDAETLPGSKDTAMSKDKTEKGETMVNKK